MTTSPLRSLVPALDIVRAVPPAPELREAGDDGPDDVLGVLHGHFSVFDSWYRISSFWEGDFVESVAPGAFRKTMAERRGQIVSAFDHGFDPQIGDKVLGPFRDLREDGTGGYYEIDLLDTSYNRDLYPGLKRGLYGASFRFQVIKDEWNEEPDASEYNPDRLPERTIREVRLFELGPVTYPANPAATAGMRSGAMRGMTDDYYARLEKRDAGRVAELRSRVLSSRTPAPAGAASHEPSEPAASHSRGMTHAARREALYPYLRGTQ